MGSRGHTQGSRGSTQAKSQAGTTVVRWLFQTQQRQPVGKKIENQQFQGSKIHSPDTTRSGDRPIMGDVIKTRGRDRQRDQDRGMCNSTSSSVSTATGLGCKWPRTKPTPVGCPKSGLRAIGCGRIPTPTLACTRGLGYTVKNDGT